MTYTSIKNMSYSVSLSIHIILLLILWLLKFTIDYPPREYVELSFGVSGEVGSSGAIGQQIEQVEELAKPEEKTQTKESNKEVKEVQLPVAKNTFDDNTVAPSEKSKEKSNNNTKENKDNTNSNVTTSGQGNLAEGDGSFGFDIDWGGKGTRKIYSYSLPSYPEGVYKEIDIRLRFTILPDGTVGNILPLIKADTKLENVAINSLRQWRFEALSPTQKQVEQAAVIVFPYRLQ
ncbi:MAG: hypothetical protein IPM56_10095 [Ignavibacteriales bacterium]|nr:MAG: hypothetical protein IPM56_10095 [Ignavibacteriales bacterium]